MDVPTKKDEPERAIGRGKHAEGRAGVPNIGQVEKPGYDGGRFMQVHGMHDESLGDLIQDHDDETDAKQDAPPLESVVHVTASMQRSQSVGCSGALAHGRTIVPATFTFFTLPPSRRSRSFPTRHLLSRAISPAGFSVGRMTTWDTINSAGNSLS